MTEHTILEKEIGYTFRDKSLLIQALTHSSYSSENNMPYASNNERLEFVGDAFLDATVGLDIYSRLPSEHEGVLSKKRAEVVCEKSLASIARKIGLGKYLYVGHGEELTGGRDKDSILADAMEAVIGAVVIDGGYDEAARLIKDLTGENEELSLKGKLFKDYKSALQEHLQAEYGSVRIIYDVIKEEGPPTIRRLPLR